MPRSARRVLSNGAATACRRAAWFVASPISAKLRWSAARVARGLRPTDRGGPSPSEAVADAGFIVGGAVCRRLASARGASSSAGCGGRCSCKSSLPQFRCADTCQSQCTMLLGTMVDPPELSEICARTRWKRARRHTQWRASAPGHASITMTLDRYGKHMALGTDEAAAEVTQFSPALSSSLLDSPICRQNVMRMRGLEPPRPYGHTDLNRARLPVPPHPRAARA